MDWARNNAELSELDLNKVFKYEPKKTTVIKIVESKNYKAQVWSLEGSDNWVDWIGKEIESMRGSERGLVLVLARRTGELSMLDSDGISIDDWLTRAEAEKPRPVKLRRAHTFAGLEEKQPRLEANGAKNVDSGRRSVRTLPFSFETFRFLSRSLHTHRSIARVVSRADVPFFSSETVSMTKPACVYNCRSSNAWAMDLALSATYFPDCGLTCSIMYGCSFDVEETIIRRLRDVTYEAAHPLLLPGIFTELEVVRHTKLVESSINKVEAKIFALESQSSQSSGRSERDVQQENEDKRAAWLDLAYLRNAIVSWNTQLVKMADHATELNEKVFKLSPPAFTSSEDIEESSQAYPETTDGWSFKTTDGWSFINTNATGTKKEDAWSAFGSSINYVSNLEEDDDRSMKEAEHEAEKLQSQKSYLYHTKMAEIGSRIKSRINTIRDEYDEKIRDCTMRLDGLSMATQWSNGETNLEIAWATNRDSKVMRSIALVTMVFLPGTLFATVFSMTFFDWFSDSGKIKVSSYLWNYVLITLVFTVLTVRLWYFFVLH